MLLLLSSVAPAFGEWTRGTRLARRGPWARLAASHRSLAWRRFILGCVMVWFARLRSFSPYPALSFTTPLLARSLVCALQAGDICTHHAHLHQLVGHSMYGRQWTGLRRHDAGGYALARASHAQRITSWCLLQLYHDATLHAYTATAPVRMVRRHSRALAAASAAR